ncbi:unnamed protein product [Polarella glacialis]|uniref:Uncharacterized protein n=1 Tax=Polarella glacialis TaxID=89957 RepID=A0A813K5X1_POLGL|nr:unnamed protein product [Polarella glacialis]
MAAQRATSRGAVGARVLSPARGRRSSHIFSFNGMQQKSEIKVLQLKMLATGLADVGFFSLPPAKKFSRAEKNYAEPSRTADWNDNDPRHVEECQVSGTLSREPPSAS